VLYAVTSHRRDTPVGIIGYLLFGALGLYTLAIFVRIIFSWVGMSYANRFMRLIVRLTEPLLRPLQRMIPRVGMFDISPLIAFLSFGCVNLRSLPRCCEPGRSSFF